MGFWSSVMSFFKSFFGKVAATATGKLAEALADIATVAVTQLASTDLSSAEKRESAFEAIKAAAIQEGLEFTTAAVNLAIESAVAVVKDQAAS